VGKSPYFPRQSKEVRELGVLGQVQTSFDCSASPGIIIKSKTRLGEFAKEGEIKENNKRSHYIRNLSRNIIEYVFF